MVNFSSWWWLISVVLVLIIDRTSAQYVTVNCYECNNCTDPFQYSNTTITITSSCNACYKLAVSIAYAPYVYVIRKCVLACLETNQMFGGGSLIAACCTSNLCNRSSTIELSRMLNFVLLAFISLNLVK